MINLINQGLIMKVFFKIQSVKNTTNIFETQKLINEN